MKKTLALFSLTLTTTAWGASNATVPLQLGGNIYPIPSWNVNGVSASSATYAFATFATGTVSSRPVTLQLLNASVLGGDSLSLTEPSGCRVGTSNIPNTSIDFLVGGTPYTTPKISDFTTAPVSTAIQFSGITTAGSVTCATNGTITYTY